MVRAPGSVLQLSSNWPMIERGILTFVMKESREGAWPSVVVSVAKMCSPGGPSHGSFWAPLQRAPMRGRSGAAVQ